MARLKKPPRASAVDEAALLLSPSSALDSADSAAGAEPAGEHPIPVSHSPEAHPPPSPPLPPSTRPSPPPLPAALGADLLNSARMNHQHTGSTGGSTARTNRAGKLKRATLIPEDSRTNLAKRGDIYEIELSPEKGNYMLPEKVNQKPLKIVKKKQGARAPGAASHHLLIDNADVSYSEQGEPSKTLDSTHLAIRSSPPVIASTGSDDITVDSAIKDKPSNGAEADADTPGDEDIVIEENLSNGRPRCTAVTYRCNKVGSGYRQCLRSGTGRTDDGVRCAVHVNKSPAVRCEMMMISDVITQCHRTATTETAHGARCTIHVENEHPVQEMTLRNKQKSVSDHEEDQPAKRPRRQVQDVDEPTSTRETESRARHSQQARVTRTSKSVRYSDQVAPVAVSQEVQVAPGHLSVDEGSDYQPDTEESENGTSSDGEAAQVVERPPSIATVFQFLDIGEREGACLTMAANLLVYQCNEFYAKFQDETISKDIVVKDALEVERMLKSSSTTVGKEYQLTFKSDAYGHVFRSLVVYLQPLHDWLLKTHDSVTESLEALRVITPVIQAILAFKDTIAQWNIRLPQRYKGDRLIKDVDILVIAPLRQVEKAFSVRLSQLEEAARRRKRYAEMRSKMEEQNEAEKTRVEALESMQERKKRWQDLHIVRMQCEPDISRRRKLFHTSFEELVERDANGVVFERLPIFKSRSAPPHSRISEIADKTEWTEEEETAVLEGLQHCAGPYVFEKIFKKYCDPRSPHPRAGDLRDRSVAEIVSKARWIRSAVLVLCQETGELVEEWVTKTPMLP